MSTPQILAAALIAVSVVVNVLIFWSNAAPKTRRPRPAAAVSIAILTGWTVLLAWGGFFNE